MQARIGELEDFYDRNCHDPRVHYVQGLLLKMQKTLSQRTHAEEGERRQEQPEPHLSRAETNKAEKEPPALTAKEEKK